MAELITLSEYKAFLGIDPTNTRDDARINALLPVATRAIKQFTDRDFSLNYGIASNRTYQYDNSGFLEIDDCTTITAVSTDAGVAGESYALNATDWTAQPAGGPIFYYLLVHGGPMGGMSPEMGFTYNLDQIGLSYKPTVMTVTATWGWPEIPADVKLAAAWIVQDATSKKDNDALSSEAIAGYSRSWVNPASGAGGMLAIPNRARDILVNYQRVY